eukprot:6193136-Pleurochrysis_carterae.AAC.1
MQQLQSVSCTAASDRPDCASLPFRKPDFKRQQQNDFKKYDSLSERANANSSNFRRNLHLYCAATVLTVIMISCAKRARRASQCNTATLACSETYARQRIAKAYTWVYVPVPWFAWLWMRRARVAHEHT